MLLLWFERSYEIKLLYSVTSLTARAANTNYTGITEIILIEETPHSLNQNKFGYAELVI